MKVIAIQGAGALGAAYASRFHNCPQFTTVFIAHGERADRLDHRGVIVNESQYYIPVVRPEDAIQHADLIIVALKHQHLTAALPDLEPFIGSNTSIISVMNGLDSERILGERYGMDKMLYAIAVGIDALREDNRITYTKIGKIFFGEKQNNIPSPRVTSIQHMLSQAGIGYETPADMMRALWWKFMVNVGMNQASAVTGAPYGEFQTHPDAQALMEALMQEVILLAACEEINLTEKDIVEWYGFLNTLSAQGKTSMLQDIEAKRPTEVDIFGGKVIVLGRKHHVPTPVNETVVRIIKVIEERYIE